MELTITIVVSMITALGIGGIIGAYFQSRFNFQTQLDQKQQELKQKRYLSIIIQMIAKLDPEIGLAKIKHHRPDLITEGDLDLELRDEFFNSIVHAGDSVVLSLGKFIDQPNYETYIRVTLAMRKDLWGKGTHIDERQLKEFVFLENLIKE